MSDTTAVSVKNVSKQFDNIEVLRDINLTVEKGTVVSILGSSGSGKSTLLRCMNWLEQPDRGEIRISAYRAEEDLILTVRDNGCGFPPDLLGPYKPPETQTGHLGLLNVDTILRKHYGDAFGLRLENPEGGGACILARLPAKGGPGV